MNSKISNEVFINIASFSEPKEYLMLMCVSKELNNKVSLIRDQIFQYHLEDAFGFIDVPYELKQRVFNFSDKIEPIKPRLPDSSYNDNNNDDDDEEDGISYEELSNQIISFTCEISQEISKTSTRPNYNLNSRENYN